MGSIRAPMEVKTVLIGNTELHFPHRFPQRPGRGFPDQWAVRPLKTRPGRKINPLKRASTPSTAMPTSRKGKRSSQTSGYSRIARRATGQQITKRRHHSRNPAIFTHPAAANHYSAASSHDTRDAGEKFGR